MTKPISPVLDPASYADTAIAAACEGDVAAMGVDLLVIRLLCALRDTDMPSVLSLLDRLESLEPVGYVLCQVCTVSLLVAADKGDQSAFTHALDHWLQGRRQFPTNWNDTILDAPELQPFLRDYDRSALELTPVAPPVMNRAEKTFIRDIAAVVGASVRDNLVHLRGLGVTASADAIARTYRLVSVSLDLREGLLSSRKDYPDLVATLDEAGGYAGSFIAH
jgi:hypothetical protein